MNPRGNFFRETWGSPKFLQLDHLNTNSCASAKIQTVASSATLGPCRCNVLVTCYPYCLGITIQNGCLLCSQQQAIDGADLIKKAMESWLNLYALSAIHRLDMVWYVRLLLYRCFFLLLTFPTYIQHFVFKFLQFWPSILDYTCVIMCTFSILFPWCWWLWDFPNSSMLRLMYLQAQGE